MGDLRDPSREKEALWALSEMTLDALRHATPALDYLCLLKCQSVFNFVAIPAVMAIATLERCFMNPDVLKKNVKIRKGEAVKVGVAESALSTGKGELTVRDGVAGVTLQLMRIAVNPRDVAYCFLKYARLIHGKTSVHDPNFVKLSIACGKVRRPKHGQWDPKSGRLNLPARDTQIEQWCEHQYPSYVSIGGSAGKIETTISSSGDDARVRLYLKLAEQQRASAALAKTQAALDRLRERGLMGPTKDGKELTAKDLEKTTGNGTDTLPWLLIAGTILGMLAVL
jgi:farnesyl-diphosphate farnesyltransferase